MAFTDSIFLSCSLSYPPTPFFFNSVLEEEFYETQKLTFVRCLVGPQEDHLRLLLFGLVVDSVTSSGFPWQCFDFNNVGKCDFHIVSISGAMKFVRCN